MSESLLEIITKLWVTPERADSWVSAAADLVNIFASLWRDSSVPRPVLTDLKIAGVYITPGIFTLAAMVLVDVLIFLTLR